MDLCHVAHNQHAHRGQGMANPVGFDLVKFAEPVSGLVDLADKDIEFFSHDDIALCRLGRHAADQLVWVAHDRTSCCWTHLCAGFQIDGWLWVLIALGRGLLRRMVLGVDLFQIVDGDMGVDLGGF